MGSEMCIRDRDRLKPHVDTSVFREVPASTSSTKRRELATIYPNPSHPPIKPLERPRVRSWWSPSRPFREALCTSISRPRVDVRAVSSPRKDRTSPRLDASRTMRTVSAPVRASRTLSRWRTRARLARSRRAALGWCARAQPSPSSPACPLRRRRHRSSSSSRARRWETHTRARRHRSRADA